MYEGRATEPHHVREDRRVIPQIATVRPSLASLGGGRNALVILEAISLSALVALTLLTVTPLLEEWGLFRAYDAQGLGYLAQALPQMPLRPLQLLPSALDWLLGGGEPVGVAIGTSVLLVARYLVARWAVTPLVDGYSRWIVATSAAVLVCWPGVWLVRFGPAQASAVLFFVALGCCIRLARRWSMPFAAAGAASVVLLLLAYQALALCLVSIPLASLSWRVGGNHLDTTRPTKAKSVLRVSMPLVLGAAVYLAYCLVAYRVYGTFGYEGQLASDGGRLLTAAGLWSQIAAVYVTAFGQEKLLFAFLYLVALFLFRDRLASMDTPRARFRAMVFVLVGVAGLPLLSLTYTSVLHVRDVDRVLFPVAVGFCLVCVSLLTQARTDSSARARSLTASAAVAVLLLASIPVALGMKHYGELQQAVISQALSAAEQSDAQVMVIRDTTGVLGDVYTLLGTTLGDAMAVEGRPIAAMICTPLGVDRIHPVAQRYPIQSTPRCEDLPPAADGSLVLTARWENGALTVKP
jgi:hypothetical protein